MFRNNKYAQMWLFQDDKWKISHIDVNSTLPLLPRATFNSILVLIKMGGLLWTGFALFSPTEKYFTLLVATEI